MTQSTDQTDLTQRRSAARRTALWFGLAAIAVYVGFIALGVLNR
ncbi:hypothetical protein [Lysobacter capsici]|nr:hypothetical protein [Lysobacter capsici]